MPNIRAIEGVASRAKVIVIIGNFYNHGGRMVRVLLAVQSFLRIARLRQISKHGDSGEVGFVIVVFGKETVFAVGEGEEGTQGSSIVVSWQPANAEAKWGSCIHTYVGRLRVAVGQWSESSIMGKPL